LNEIPGHSGDYRTIDKIIDNFNITTDDKHMWLIPFTRKKSHIITIIIPGKPIISAIKIYNYNRTPEDTVRGACRIQIYCDNNEMSPPEGILIPKSYGNSDFDFGYLIQFPYKSEELKINEKLSKLIQNEKNASWIVKNAVLKQYYEPYLHPCGFTFEIKIYSNYGDKDFIGINSVELYDFEGNLINSNDFQTNISPQIPKEFLQKDAIFYGQYKNQKLLVNSENIQSIKNQEIYKIYFRFQNPMILSAIRFINYDKNPLCGVKDFIIFCDTCLIFEVFFLLLYKLEKGVLKKANNSEGKISKTTVLFTSDLKIQEKFKGELAKNPKKYQDVDLINENDKINLENSINSKENSLL